MRELDDIHYNYLCVNHDLECLLQILEILLEHYEQAGGYRETERLLHIIKKNLEAGQKELRKNNNEFDEYLMEH